MTYQATIAFPTRFRPVAMLKRHGFAPAGEIVLTGRGIALQGTFPPVPGVYAFVIDGREVGYVGSGDRLSSRLAAYAYAFGVEYKKKHRKVRLGLRELLEAGARITVWLRTDVCFTLACGLATNNHAGIERAMIDLLREHLLWNSLHVKRRGEWDGASNQGAIASWATRRRVVA